MNGFLAKIDLDFLIFLGFILLPILARVMRGLGEGGEGKQGVPRRRPAGRTSGKPAEGGLADLEREGREAWRRLLEGLGPAAGAEPPEVLPVPEKPAPPPVAPPQKNQGHGRPKPHRDVGREGLPSEGKVRPPRPEPLPEPATHLEAHERKPIAGRESVHAREGRRPLRSRAEAAAADVPALRPSVRELRRALVWSEVLGPPVALRRLDEGAPGLRIR